MIYLQIHELIQAKKMEWSREITFTEVAEATGISRMTLFRMIKDKNHNTMTDHIDRLCAYFECELHELISYVPNDNTKTQLEKASNNKWGNKIAA